MAIGFGFFIIVINNTVNVFPSRNDLATSASVIEKIEKWHVKSNTGTDIYLKGGNQLLRLNIADCEEALKSLSIGDFAKVAYKVATKSRIDGRVISIEVKTSVLCSFEQSVQQHNRQRNSAYCFQVNIPKA